MKDHVLLPFANELEKADQLGKAALTPAVIENIVSLVPDEWLETAFNEPVDIIRDMYNQFLNTRISNSAIFLKEAQDARTKLI